MTAHVASRGAGFATPHRLDTPIGAFYTGSRSTALRIYLCGRGGSVESHVKSAERVLAIFEAVASAPRGLTFTALQQTLGIPKSSLYALLTVLSARGYLEIDLDTREYTIGIRLWERSQAYHRHHTLVGEALPVMRSIVDTINETTQLAVLDGIENVYLAAAGVVGRERRTFLPPECGARS